jgi:hypothetical protein
MAIEITGEMAFWHNERMDAHIELVQNILKAAEASNEQASLRMPLMLARTSAMSHDSDKCAGGTLHEPYVLISWAYRELKNGREFPYTPEMKEGTRQHCMNNLHHPEAWDKRYETDFKLFDTGSERDAVPDVAIDASKMRPEFLVEMVADWKATALERGNLALAWYKTAVPHRFKFTEAQTWFIEEMLRLVEPPVSS